MALDAPHFDLPLRLNGSRFAAVEQDSDREILNCCHVVLSTEQGACDEEPEFGLPSQLFRQGGADLDEIEAALAEWEPRSDAVAESVEFEQLIQRVRVEV